MIIILPVVGTDSGVVGCDKVVTALQVIVDGFNSHDHVTEGLNIPSAAIDINADLSFQDNRLTSAQGVGFQTQASFPTPPRGLLLFTLHSAPRDDLWFNDGVSDIQITSGGGILTSLDGFVDDYINNVLGSGKAGYSIGSNAYTFSNGDNATGAIASSISHVRFKTMLSLIDYGEFSYIVGSGDNGAGSDTSGALVLQSSAVNQGLAQGSLVAYGVGLQPPGYASDLSPVTALMSNSRLYLSAQIVGADPTGEVHINKANTTFSGDHFPADDATYILGGTKLGTPYIWDEVNAYKVIPQLEVNAPPDGNPTMLTKNNGIVCRGTFQGVGAITVSASEWNVDETNMSRTGPGVYTIQLDNAVSTDVTVIATSNDTSGVTRICHASYSYSVPNGTITVKIFDEAGAAADSDFSVVAIGL